MNSGDDICASAIHVVIKKEKKNYHHVVVMDRSTLLEEHGDCESNVLSSSMEIRLIPSFEPIGNFCNIKKLLLLQVTGKLFRKKQYHIASTRERKTELITSQSSFLSISWECRSCSGTNRGNRNHCRC